MPSANKTLILIDGSSYLFRAYHALPPLTTSNGQPTGAVYGVINMIKKLMNTYAYEYIAVVFDPKGKTFRHTVYPEYKANRATMPDALREQIKPLYEVIRAMGLPLMIQDGVEADDVIGTLAVYAEKHGINTLISTMDKDMAQLVNENVTLINTMTDRVLDVAGVKEKFNVAPHHIIDYLALMGDTSDNVPGIPTVGPKTAAQWIAQYGSLDHIIAHADKIPGKVGDNLRAHLKDLSLARELVTIQCDVTMDLQLSALKKKEANTAQLQKLFSTLEFTKWLRELQTDTPRAHAPYRALQTEKDFLDYVTKIKDEKEISLDTETTGIDAMRADLVGMSLSIQSGDAVYIPLKHTEMNQPQLNTRVVLQTLSPLLHDKNKIIVGQNLKYDYKILKRAGVTIESPMQDTMLESYVLNSTSARHDLDTLALKYLSHKTITFEDVAGKGAKQVTFDQVSIAAATQYAAEDADIALQLHHVLLSKIKKEPSCYDVLTRIEWPLMPILANMEFHGVLIDAAMLKTHSAILAKRIVELEQRSYALVNKTFNLGSPKQLQAILFDELHLPVLKKTPTGAPSTDEEVMQELSLDFELPQLIVEYRQLSKLKSTYTDALPEQINPITGRVHTSYNQAVTSTGRLSSTNPNLQNIPVRNEEGRKIRQAFIAPLHCKIVSADYSQIELRIMAHLSKDPGLLSAFEKKQDIHSATAAEVFGVAIHDVTHDMRRHAKAINFGLLYGMSAFGLAKQLGVGRDQAQHYMDLYFKRYPNVHRYMEEARLFASHHGYVETLFGRRLAVPDIHASNRIRKTAAERAAINAPLQGTAADIIKCAMIAVDAAFSKHQLPATMIMQVHDELVFEVDKNHVSAVCDVIKQCMENAFTMDVPLEVVIGVGDHWDEAH